MIYLEETQESFNTNINLSDLSLEPIPVEKKPVDKRGYIYVVIDSAFPDHIKVGRTNDPKKRLAAYNSDKPFNTAKFKVISCLFTDVVDVERVILEQVYAKTEPTTLTKEWFEIEHYNLILSWIELAEDQAGKVRP